MTLDAVLSPLETWMTIWAAGILTVITLVLAAVVVMLWRFLWRELK